MTGVRFARSGDVDVAYRVLGDGPIDLVYVQGAYTHLEIDCELPAYRRYCERLAEFTRLVVFGAVLLPTSRRASATSSGCRAWFGRLQVKCDDAGSLDGLRTDGVRDRHPARRLRGERPHPHRPYDRRSALQRRENARLLARTIRGARLAEIREFLTGRRRELLEQHHAAVRRELERFGGREVDTAGDGFFATFEGPARAIRCARAIVESVRPLGLEVRVGLHTGEVELLDGKVAGIAVNIGARWRLSAVVP